MPFVRVAVLALLTAVGATAPAAAEDCFVWVVVGGADRAAPIRHQVPGAPRPHHHLHHLHHTLGKAHPRPRQMVAAAAPGEGPHHMQALLAQHSVQRPISCDKPVLQSKAPHPAAAQRLLDAFVSPAPRPVLAQAPVITPLAGGPIGGWPLAGESPGTSPIQIASGPPGGQPAGGQPPVSAAPEPATWAMLFLGFAGVGSVLRARQRRLNMDKSQ